MELLDNFGRYVFNDTVMRQRLPKAAYESLRRTRKLGIPLDPSIADTVATCMRDWAVAQGATHYVHWFQPMTDAAAGKSEGFLVPDADGTAILEFSPTALVQGEPDASSFPSGGIRNTFEARGYTAWDPTSSVFVRDKTLYIPTAFCAHSGEALDQKTPLLRSMDAVSTQAVRLLKILGDDTVSRVIPQVGAEQEYFLIDREKYEKRLDLKLCGRTLIGCAPPKSQELDDHYYARVRIRVAAFMQELDQELWKLGIAAKTKHNEVAPTQHELAVVYESANIACDSNQLVMEMMKTVAKHHNLACLLHEKPFARVNGSGKHNNYSLATDTGVNLLSPGKCPKDNPQFLLFLCAFIRGVDRYSPQLRLSTATASNDYRLGGFEAPPAIISMFLGDSLVSTLQNCLDGSGEAGGKSPMHFGVSSMPELLRDDCDRNRTSPLAFTGNKFEFRMPGSSQSIAFTDTVLNTIVADSLAYFADRLQASSNLAQDIKLLICETYAKHGRIIFNGNNYSQEWQQEAKGRGLPCYSNCVDAIGVFKEEATIDLFERFGVLSKSECHSRYEVMMESYRKIVLIEASTLLEMMRRQILPAIIRCAGENAQHLAHIRSVGLDNQELEEYVRRLLAAISELKNCSDNLAAHISARPTHQILTECSYIRDVIKTDMDTIRQIADRVEAVIGEDCWPIPTYTDLMHRV